MWHQPPQFPGTCWDGSGGVDGSAYPGYGGCSYVGGGYDGSTAPPPPPPPPYYGMYGGLPSLAAAAPWTAAAAGHSPPSLAGYNTVRLPGIV